MARAPSGEQSMPGRRTFLLLPLLAAALLSCADLPVIEEDRCGNGFIEAGEDCDELGATANKGQPSEGVATCNAPGEANQCRYHCDKPSECQIAPVSDQGSGWRCGVDKVCRRPQGDDQGNGAFFTPVSSLIPGGADALFSGDFDGDGRKDLLAVGAAGFDVHYFTRDLAVARSLHIPGAPMRPAIGKLTATNADDFTIDVGQGLSVMLGRPGQTIEPTSYASLDIKKRYQSGSDAGTPDDMQLLIVDTGATVPGPSMTNVRVGPGPLALSVSDGMMTLIDASSDPQDGKAILATFPVSGSKALLGTIPVAFPKPGADRQRFLLAFRGDASVYVMDAGATGLEPIKSAIALPPGRTVHGAAFFGDANADGLIDVFVGAADCSKGATKCEVAEIDVAYGDGNGDFSSVAKTDPAWSPAALHQASPYLNVYPGGDPHPNPKGQLSALEIERYLPLALGRFDTDLAVDYVNAFGIYTSDGGGVIGCGSAPNGYCEADRPSGGELWSEVKVSDFNATGSVDVAAVSRGNPGIDFFSGTGTGVFNTFSIPTEGPPSSLSVGDFDGDLLPDIAFDSATTNIGGDANTLFVAFGRAIGAPELPVSMGKVANLRQIVSGDLSSFGNNAASDIVLLSGIPATYDASGKKTGPGKSWTVGLSQGNGYRQLQAPLTFFEKKTLRIGAAPLASAIGRFDDDMSIPSEPASRADVAAVMQSFKPTAMTAMGEAPFCQLQASLWLLPATGDAAIEPPAVGVRSIPISTLDPSAPDHFLPARQFVEAVPIDAPRAEDRQRLLIAFPTYDKCAADLAEIGAHGTLLLASFDAGGQPTLTSLINPVGKNEFLIRLRVGDIDGDGIPDLAALQTKLDFNLGQLVASTIVVLRGDAKGSFRPRVSVPLPGPAMDFALVNTDRDEDLELVIVSARKDLTDSRADFTVADWDDLAEDATMPFRTTLLPRGGGDDSTSNSEESVLDRPTALAGGDFDGDGVDDVAVAIAGGVRVFKGVAR